MTNKQIIVSVIIMYMLFNLYENMTMRRLIKICICIVHTIINFLPKKSEIKDYFVTFFTTHFSYQRNFSLNQILKKERLWTF